MRHVSTWLRRALIVLIVLGLAVFAARQYVASRHVANQVAASLETMCGAPVEIGEVDVGFDGSIVRGLKLFETATTVSIAVPWAVVSEIQTDAALWSVLSGETTPRRVTLSGAAVTLQFDAEGHLLTRLPSGSEARSTLPEIEIEQSQLTLRQEGRPDLVVNNISAALRGPGPRMTFTGTINDPQWGDWTASGNVTWPYETATLELKTTRLVHVTQAMLGSLPFVPAKTWQHVQAEGDTDATIVLASEAGKRLRYRLDLHPQSTKVHVTKIDLDGVEARGHVIVEDEQVHLRDVSGTSANGRIETHSDMDFRNRPYSLAFAIGGRDLEVQGLPRLWGWPALLSGRISGKVDLHVSAEVGHARLTGDGQGEITGVRIAGIPADKLRIRLVNDGSGFRFLPQQSSPWKN
jgi:hypothetical protein